MHKYSSKLYSAAFIALLIIFDYISKTWVSHYLKNLPGYTKDFTSFFGFVYSWNYGISFGIFSQYYQYSNLTFIILNCCIVIYLLIVLYKAKTCIQICGYGLIIGGALGNLYDRIQNGAVFDFLYFHLHKYHFPVFNLADTFISLGVAVLLYDIYKHNS